MAYSRRASITALFAALAAGCTASPDTEPDETEPEPTVQTGGSAGASAGTGGKSGATGGTRATGGATAAGGTSSAGGAKATGGTADFDGGNPACAGTATDGGRPPASGTPGVWEDVTPAGVDLSSSYGVQDVIADPARPSDLYAFVCYQGVYKSADYGSTWTHVSTGTNGAELELGRPWSAGIDSNPCRDPGTPPTLYTFSGYGHMQGFWKSTDGGVSWNSTELPPQPTTTYPQDAYSVDVNPYDGKHLLLGMHERSGLLESTDGGESFVALTPGDGMSVYYFFVDTGSAATTRTTWLSLAQSGTMGRTTNGAASWTQVETLEHAHGCSQIFQAGGGVIYAPGNNGTQGNGIYRSADYGAKWTKVSSGSENSVVGTATTLYASYAWANGGGVDPTLKTSPRSSGTTWTSMTAPSGMTNGSKRASVTFDGTHYIIVSGNWNGGIWRYVEP